MWGEGEFFFVLPLKSGVEQSVMTSAATGMDVKNLKAKLALTPRWRCNTCEENVEQIAVGVGGSSRVRSARFRLSTAVKGCCLRKLTYSRIRVRRVRGVLELFFAICMSALFLVQYRVCCMSFYLCGAADASQGNVP